jgi:hypothetical protein
LVFLTFSFSIKEWFIFIKEVLYKASMITLVEINFGRRKNDNYYMQASVGIYACFHLTFLIFFVPFSIALDTNGEILAIKE